MKLNYFSLDRRRDLKGGNCRWGNFSILLREMSEDGNKFTFDFLFLKVGLKDRVNQRIGQETREGATTISVLTTRVRGPTVED